MKEEVERDGGKEDHAAWAQDTCRSNVQHAMQHQEDGQGSIAVHKEDRQGGVNQALPGQPRHAQGDNGLVAKNIRERATRCVRVRVARFYTIQPITDNGGHQQPEGDFELKRGQQAESYTQKYGGIGKHICADM